MPAGLLPDEGIADQLAYLLQRSISGVLPWSLIFFVNDIEPTSDTVLSDLEEASFGGYVRLTMTRNDWVIGVPSEGCVHATWQSYAQVWYCTAGPVQTIYGYAYVDFTAGVIRFIQRFDPDDVAELPVGGRILLLPEYTLRSAECM
jgi:hypothetical protein